MMNRSLDSDTLIGVPIWTAPLAEEPAHGLAMRLAEVNAYPKLQNVVDTTGLSLPALHRGEQLQDLADLIRRPVEVVSVDSFKLGEDGKVTIRGQKLNFKLDYELQSRRACPACLRESAHHRFMWDIAFVTTCPRHGLKLEDTCQCGSGRKLGWSDPRVYRGRCCKGGDLRLSPGETADPNVVAMDAYFAGRLGVGEKIEVSALDELELCDAVELLDRVGGLALGGYSRQWQRYRRHEINGSPIMATAFRILREGRFQEVLEAAYQGFLGDPQHKPVALTSAYGWFYHWYNLKGNQRFSRFLTEEIYRHAASSFRIDRRAMRNKSIDVSAATYELMDAFDRGRMTLSQAARFCGCHLIQLRRLAVTYGLMREEKLVGRVVLLKTADIEILRVILQRMIVKREAAALINAPARFVTRLERDGVIVPILAASAISGEYVAKYLVDDFHDLLALLERRSVRQPIKGRGVSMYRATGPYSLSAIVCEVDAGRLFPHIEDEGAVGIARYRFRRADLKECRHSSSAALDPKPGPDFEWLRAKIEAVAGGKASPAARGRAGRRDRMASRALSAFA